jgi:hypothetical protein
MRILSDVYVIRGLFNIFLSQSQYVLNDGIWLFSRRDLWLCPSMCLEGLKKSHYKRQLV